MKTWDFVQFRVRLFLFWHRGRTHTHPVKSIELVQTQPPTPPSPPKKNLHVVSSNTVSGSILLVKTSGGEGAFLFRCASSSLSTQPHAMSCSGRRVYDTQLHTYLCTSTLLTMLVKLLSAVTFDPCSSRKSSAFNFLSFFLSSYFLHLAPLLCLTSSTNG